MKIHRSKIEMVSVEDCAVESVEFLLSELLSAWLFSVKIWTEVNAKNGSMFDQYEEDEASLSEVASMILILSEKMSELRLKDALLVEFVYGWRADKKTIHSKNPERAVAK